jgi:hypothetical protein
VEARGGEIGAIHPQLVLVSGAPLEPEALEGLMVLSTTSEGWIHLSTDGEELRVEVERK